MDWGIRGTPASINCCDSRSLENATTCTANAASCCSPMSELRSMQCTVAMKVSHKPSFCASMHAARPSGGTPPAHGLSLRATWRCCCCVFNSMHPDGAAVVTGGLGATASGEPLVASAAEGEHGSTAVAMPETAAGPSATPAGVACTTGFAPMAVIGLCGRSGVQVELLSPPSLLLFVVSADTTLRADAGRSWSCDRPAAVVEASGLAPASTTAEAACLRACAADMRERSTSDRLGNVILSGVESRRFDAC